MTVRLFIARPMPGVVGETRRVVHVFPLWPDGTVPQRVTALCGAEFGHGQLELLDQPAGMPCERCLSCTPPTRELGDGS